MDTVMAAAPEFSTLAPVVTVKKPTIATVPPTIASAPVPNPMVAISRYSSVR